MNLTETEDYPTSTLPARADALMERMIAHGMSALGPDDYETIYQALEATVEVRKTKAAVAIIQKQMGLPSDLTPSDVKALFSLPDDDDTMHSERRSR